MTITDLTIPRECQQYQELTEVSVRAARVLNDKYLRSHPRQENRPVSGQVLTFLSEFIILDLSSILTSLVLSPSSVSPPSKAEDGRLFYVINIEKRQDGGKQGPAWRERPRPSLMCV